MNVQNHSHMVRNKLNGCASRLKTRMKVEAGVLMCVDEKKATNFAWPNIEFVLAHA